MNTELQLILLGKPEIIQNEEPVNIFHKAQALFYYLAVTGGSHRRLDLLNLLWHQIQDQERARNNLRVTLSYLRKRFSKHLLINRHTISFNHKSSYWLDTEVLKKAFQSPPRTIEELQSIVEVYRGEFLEGFQVPEEDMYEEWIINERQKLHSLAVQALQSLISLYQEGQRYPEAIETANLLLELEPEREDTRKTLMDLLAAAGQRGNTLEQYEICRQILKRKEDNLSSKVIPDYVGNKQMLNQKQAENRHFHLSPYPLIEEQRQVTLMFCHWRETQSAEDVETWHIHRQKSQQICIEVVKQFKGEVIRHNDSGILIAFGCPHAYENSVQWAIETGLQILSTFKQLTETNVHPLAIGIHTGKVITVTKGGLQQIDVIGQSPDFVQQLARLALDNTLLISAATYTLVKGFFMCRPLDSSVHRLVEQTVYEVDKQLPVFNGIQATQANHAQLTPLVNRQQELNCLHQDWMTILHGTPRAVTIEGEVGIGKSRLVHELIQDIKHMGDTAPTILPCQCSKFHQHQPFYPFVTMFRHLLGSYTVEQLKEKLLHAIGNIEKSHINGAAVDLKTTVDLLVDVAQQKDEFITVETQVQQTLNELLDLLLTVVSQRNVLLVIENLHYADQLTLTFLSLLFEKQLQPQTKQHLYTVLTTRPEFEAPWPNYAHMTTLQLNRISLSDTEVLLNSITNNHALSAQTKKIILENSEGIPLFAEALAETYQQTTATDVETVTIPARLYDILLMPVEQQPSPIKEVIQLASVLGKEFSYKDIQTLWEGQEKDLQHALALLVQKRLLYPRGYRIPQIQYKFKYALLQTLMYQSLLKKQIQALHDKQTLEHASN